ncbi:transporter substrate-binding domain-containing protein [Paenibacillus albiflavus]|uniref:Transporter substrate-binding domain-containing protein n=1 Tax=Paenibacillus albiflavus TaxID=2545760 RepID=A0A4R4EFA8_9BACL|nr:transporter substrate-binding domain-containing protein [Paenibacillus albiflavus]TCZ78744.1 transporter substrate-binding domain-containing protein [Paenibacillus albiflavus]
MTIKSFGKITLTALLSIALLAGCGSKTDKGADGTATPAADGKVITVALNATYAPFEFVDTTKGTKEIVGLDIDIINYIAKQLDASVKITDMPFPSVVASLTEGRADVAISGISPTPERKQNVDFSDSYYQPRIAIIAPKGSNYTSFEQLEGKKLAIAFGTTYEQTAKKIKGVTVTALDDVPSVIQEINNKRADATILDDTTAAEYLAKNPKLEINLLPAENSEDAFAIAFPKGSKWLEPVNQELKKMKENGELNKIIEKWLGAEFVK